MALRVRVLLLFAFPGLLHAQIQLLPLDYQATNGRISVIQQQKDTLTLPFWDDFSQSDGTPDTGKWYTGRHIFINNSLPVNPPTLNVATFDGVNEFGRAHAHNSSLSGAGDSLISQPINLAAVPKSKWSTVYFSFFWQLRGFGELPDANDSLSLYFLSRDSVWVLQKITSPDDYHFSLTGGLNNLQFDKDSIQAFRQVILPVSNDIFFHKGFSFKFVSHSSLSGLYDTWHVDYVYLNADRQANDTYHYDRAISGQPSGLLYPYLEMPGHQFLANPSRYSTTLHYAVSNLDNSYHPNECTFELINTASGVSTGLITQVSPRLLPGETGRKNQLVLPALDPLIDADSVVLESKITYLTGDKRLFETVTTANDTLFFPIDLRMNDTLTQRYTLHNYYAYDDGSAEFAAGINLYGGQLAVAFVVE
ncbi:MAG: hypothetical protein OEY56_12230, partial [Cyclobacteriaceae bacterium]|nr:hypothetical protein [Cyclobacteriaceae bacterium]